MAAIPYAPAAAFLGREKGKLMQREGDPLRVALVADAVGGMHGVTHTLDEIRERGVPGFEVEVVGTDANVDRRLSAVAEVDIPFYAGLKVGVPSLPAIVEALAEGRYDLVHLCSPGPAGVAAAVIARVMEVPVLGSYHTELAAYAGLRAADPKLEFIARAAIAAFYGQCQVVLSPSPASDDVLRGMGIDAERIGRWDRGVDVGRFSPARRDAAAMPGELSVLYAGRLTREKGADLLADAFLAARERDPRLHLCLAGGGPEEDALRERLGEHASFLGWLEGDALADAYASADLFLFASRTDTFGQVLLEAQASGLPVVAVAEGGPCSIVEDGVTGRLLPARRARAGRRGRRARGRAAAARAPCAERARDGARAHVGARPRAAGRGLPPGAGRAAGRRGAACRVAHSGSSIGRLRRRATVSRSARRQATGGSPRRTSSRSATTRRPMAWKASGMPPVRWGESSRPSTERAGWSAGTGSRGHTSTAARRRPAAARSTSGVEVNHGCAAHDEHRGALRQELELAPSEHRLVVGRGRGEDEDHPRGAQQLLEAGGLGARGADGQVGQPRVVGAHATAEGREQAHELAARGRPARRRRRRCRRAGSSRRWRPRGRRTRCPRAWRGRPR